MNALLSEEERRAIQEILMEKLDVSRAQLTPEARIEEDLNADSIDQVDIAMAMEERFGLTLPDEIVERMLTVRDVEEAIGAALHPHHS